LSCISLTSHKHKVKLQNNFLQCAFMKCLYLSVGLYKIHNTSDGGYYIKLTTDIMVEEFFIVSHLTGCSNALFVGYAFDIHSNKIYTE
jgi:hypothetical protein